MRKTWVLTLFVFLGTACASPPKTEFFATPKVVSASMARVSVQPGLLAELNLVNSAIRQYLSDNGVSVAAAEESRAHHALALEESGPLFDATTGEPRPDAYSAYQHSFVEHALETGTTSVLHVSVVRVSAILNQGGAFWCGHSQTIRTPDQAADARRLDIRGTVPALCLRVQLSTVGGEKLYAGEGGVHVLSEFDPRTLISTMHMVLNSRSEALSDPEDIDRAVRLALEPLVSVR